MRFDIKAVERIRRRNKSYHPCMENWNSYDSKVLKEHIKYVGCTAPYQNRIENIPACSTKHQIKESMFIMRNDGYKKDPPCQSFERVDYVYAESELKDTMWEGEGTFWIGLYINNQKFKEVVERQAIDFNGLIGYIGGYIGLILGYNILQIPEFFMSVKLKFEEIIL